MVRLSGLGLAPAQESDACVPSSLDPGCLNKASLWSHEGPRWQSRQLQCPYAEHIWEGALPSEDFECQFDPSGTLICQASLQVCMALFEGHRRELL